MREDLAEETAALADLTRPEHLLIWALRAIAVGNGDCPLVARTFDKACGRLGGQAMHAYFALVKYIGMTGRRRLRVHTPGCPCVSVDETAIVGVVAAAQSDAPDGGESLLKMRLRFLVEGEPHEAFLSAARAVAQAFKVAGLKLPLRLMADAQVASTPARLRVVH